MALIDCCSAAQIYTSVSIKRPAYAQIKEATADDDIVVTGRKSGLNETPLLKIEASQLQVYAGDDLGEVLEKLNAIADNQGQPFQDRAITLLNGRRLADNASISSIPSEAIERIDILDAAAATKLGLFTRRPILNVILKKRHKSTTVSSSAHGSVTLENGGASQKAFAFLLEGSTRFTVAGNYDVDTARFFRLANGRVDEGRTLSPSSRMLQGSASLSADLWGIAEVNANLSASSSGTRSKLGTRNDGSGTSAAGVALLQSANNQSLGGNVALERDRA